MSKSLKLSQYGGIKELANDNEVRKDLIQVWNSLFYKKFSKVTNKNGNKVITRKDIEFLPNKKRALFVIDMQKDFVDAPYDRNDNDKNKYNCTESTAIPNTKLGNFPVAQGSSLFQDNNETSQTPMLEYISTALDDNDCVTVFSRDYHPAGHMSFGDHFGHIPYCREINSILPNNYKNEDPATIQITDSISVKEGTGNFPPHCIQECAGTLFCTKLETLLKSKTNGQNNHIVFKGVHKGCDSFTAVDKKDKVDSFASNQNINDLQVCCSGTGAYYGQKDGTNLSFEDAIDFLGKVTPSKNNKVHYNNLLTDVDTIEVCGLAGDYCVRDTATSLANMFPDKQIYILNDYTRYAVLPLFSVDKLPIHDYNQNLQTGQAGIQHESLNRFLSKDIKDIYNYLINYNVNNNEYRLLSSDDLKSLTIDKLKLAMGVPGPNGNLPTYQHFITPQKAIINDYANYNNLFVKMNAGESTKGGRRTRKRSRRRRSHRKKARKTRRSRRRRKH